MTEQEYQARIEELEKKNLDMMVDDYWRCSEIKRKSFNSGLNYGAIVGGLACIVGGILGMIYDHYSENKKNKKNK